MIELAIPLEASVPIEMISVALEHSVCGGFVIPCWVVRPVAFAFGVVTSTGVTGLPVRVGIIGGFVVTCSTF